MNEPRQYAGNQSPFQEYYDRVYGDKRGILFGGGNLQPLELNLNAAQSLKDFELQGDFIWMDPDSTGDIRVKFSMAQPRAMTMRANYRFARVPFKQLLIEWDAQPGETAILWTGWGVEALPSANDITNLSNIINPVTVQEILSAVEVKGPRSYNNAPVLADLPVLVREIGYVAASNFLSNATFAADTAQTIFSAASNANGAIVWEGSFWHRTGTTGTISTVLAKSSAPVNTGDGEGIITQQFSQDGGAVWYSSGQLARPRFIAAGYGLYEISNIATTARSSRYSYTLF